MKNVILVSHGTFAYGMHSVLDMFAGKREEVKSTCLEDGMSTDVFKENLQEIINGLDPNEEILVFTDIAGGSPYTMSLELLEENGLLGNASVFAGMNVLMCLTAVISKDTMDRKSLEELVLQESKNGISLYQTVDDEEEEEDL